MTAAVDEGRVRLDVAGTIGTLWFDRPARGNALSIQMMVEAASLLRSVPGGAVRALIVRGAGDRHFCTGYDLLALPDVRRLGEDGATGDAVIPELMELLDALEGFPAPTIGAVDGSAIGGGVLLLSFCDEAFVGTGARLQVPASRLGMMYPLRGLRRLAAVAGLARAQRWLAGGSEIPLAEAEGAGWIQLVREGSAADAARVRAAELSERAPLVLSGLAATLRAVGRGDPSAREIHSEAMARCIQSADIVEGLLAKAERRPPRFEGR